MTVQIRLLVRRPAPWISCSGPNRTVVRVRARPDFSRFGVLPGSHLLPRAREQHAEGRASKRLRSSHKVGVNHHYKSTCIPLRTLDTLRIGVSDRGSVGPKLSGARAKIRRALFAVPGWQMPSRRYRSVSPEG